MVSEVYLIGRRLGELQMTRDGLQGYLEGLESNLRIARERGAGLDSLSLQIDEAYLDLEAVEALIGETGQRYRAAIAADLCYAGGQ